MVQISWNLVDFMDTPSTPLPLPENAKYAVYFMMEWQISWLESGGFHGSEIWQISWMKSGGFHGWNLADFMVKSGRFHG